MKELNHRRCDVDKQMLKWSRALEKSNGQITSTFVDEQQADTCGIEVSKNRKDHL